MNNYTELYKTVLFEYQKFSKCARLQVAAILVENGRILCCGYNGTPSGQCNCNKLFQHIKLHGIDYYNLRNLPDDDWQQVNYETWYKQHHIFANANELHAEMNCIATACKNNIPVQNCSMVISLAPCENCAKLIYASGIKHVMYINEYDRGSNGNKFLIENGVKVEQI